MNYRNSSVRYVGTTVIGDVGLLSGILRNGAINMVCVALAFQIPKTSMKLHQSRYVHLSDFLHAIFRFGTCIFGVE